MLLGLAFPNNNANTVTNNDNNQAQPIVQLTTQGGPTDPVGGTGGDGDTSGGSGQKPPL